AAPRGLSLLRRARPRRRTLRRRSAGAPFRGAEGRAFAGGRDAFPLGRGPLGGARGGGRPSRRPPPSPREDRPRRAGRRRRAPAARARDLRGGAGVGCVAPPGGGSRVPRALEDELRPAGTWLKARL